MSSRSITRVRCTGGCAASVVTSRTIESNEQKQNEAEFVSEVMLCVCYPEYRCDASLAENIHSQLLTPSVVMSLSRHISMQRTPLSHAPVMPLPPSPSVY